MRKILAISGGIDSMVLMDMMKDENPIIAHFDHGIRANSHEDRLFVERKAKEYGLEFVSETAKLGEDCSEEKARAARYDFLFGLCERKKGELYVAHHADDVVESIAINLIRGTGWRGLAPLRRTGVHRPLLRLFKSDICRYAGERGLTFREDPTNNTEDYLRNRVRAAIQENLSKSQKLEILNLYTRQVEVSNKIDGILMDLCGDNSNRISKELICSNISNELLRFWLKRNNISLTRPQLERVKNAINTFLPGKKCDLSRGKSLKIGKYYIAIE